MPYCVVMMDGNELLLSAVLQGQMPLTPDEDVVLNPKAPGTRIDGGAHADIYRKGVHTLRIRWIEHATQTVHCTAYLPEEDIEVDGA